MGKQSSKVGRVRFFCAAKKRNPTKDLTDYTEQQLEDIEPKWESVIVTFI